MKHLPLLALLGIAATLATPAHALDKLRVGKAVETSFPMTIADFGAANGTFAKYGLDLEITSFTGDAKMQQAFVAGSIDVGLGSGPAMAFEIKGAPTIAIAAFAGPPYTISLAVIPDSPVKKPADLKGKTVAISTTGSLTEWLAKRLSVTEGWGPNGLKLVALGAGSAMNGALITKQIDAMMTGTENASVAVDKGQVRVVTGMESFAPDFITHVAFATKALVHDKPDLARRFVQGFFASMAMVKADKAKAVAFFAPFLNEKPSVFATIYDTEMPMLIADGHFDPKAVAVLKDSFLDMGILDKKPSDDQLFTTQFVPVKF